MGGRHAKVPRRVLLTWFVLASGILLLIPHRITSRFQFATLDLLRLPIRSGRMIGLWAQTSASPGGLVSQKDYDALLQQNRELLNQTSNLEAAVFQQQQQIDQLAGVRQAKGWDQMDLLAADVSRRIDPYHLDIDLGSAQGITKGMLVMAEKAIVGTITDVGTHSSRVEWVTSRTSKKLPVTVLPSNVQGVLTGLGDGFMKIQAKPPCPAAVGDTVCVQRIPGLLDQMVIVGIVAQCGKDEQEPVLSQIKVQPVCDLDRITSVWVLKMKTPYGAR
jgi:cell shape-determining protein MreC